MILAVDDPQDDQSKTIVGNVVPVIESSEVDQIIFYGERAVPQIIPEMKATLEREFPGEIKEIAGLWFMAVIESLSHAHFIPVIDLTPLTAALR